MPGGRNAVRGSRRNRRKSVCTIPVPVYPERIGTAGGATAHNGLSIGACAQYGAVCQHGDSPAPPAVPASEPEWAGLSHGQNAPAAPGRSGGKESAKISRRGGWRRDPLGCACERRLFLGGENRAANGGRPQVARWPDCARDTSRVIRPISRRAVISGGSRSSRSSQSLNTLNPPLTRNEQTYSAAPCRSFSANCSPSSGRMIAGFESRCGNSVWVRCPSAGEKAQVNPADMRGSP